MAFKTKTIGILGGGQLGRMSALAAARLGFKTRIFCPEEKCPASQVTPFFNCAEYNDEQALKAFADSVDVISYEFENIPVETVRFLKEIKPVYPDENLLEIAQHRVREKEFLNSIGILTAPFAPIKKPADIDMTFGKWGLREGILKTSRFGYDGKGQIRIFTDSSSEDAWNALNTDDAILEGIVDFECEISMVVARDLHGQMAVYPPAKNEHENHILSRTLAPYRLEPAQEKEAADIAHKLAEAVNLVGVLAIELFLTKDGKLLANEIAPRTHNSGHWTIDGCTVSQFENHIRCVAGLPAGNPATYADCEMINLIGDDIELANRYSKEPGAHIHLYGKKDVKPGRKMGHITLVRSLQDTD